MHFISAPMSPKYDDYYEFESSSGYNIKSSFQQSKIKKNKRFNTKTLIKQKRILHC